MASRSRGRLVWILAIGAIVLWLSHLGDQDATHSSGNSRSNFPAVLPAKPTQASRSAPQPTSTATKNIQMFTTARLRLRDGPSTDARIITTLEAGIPLISFARSGVWHHVTVGLQSRRGWVHGDYLSTKPPASETKPRPQAPLTGQSFTCTIPIPTLKDQMIRESIARYPGSCPCPYNLDRGGRRCGGRSAWSKPGGYSPLCYPNDISPNMVREFCEVLKVRGQGR